MKTLCITSGISLLLIALIAGGLSLLAIADPVGTKLADDNGPIGPPPSRIYSLSIFVGSVVLSAAGIFLVRRPFCRNSHATNAA